jgi:glycosyltransferase involved in cell wall biosynthesis
MKVLVAHNLYRRELPSGENSAVRQEIDQLHAAGVDVHALLPSSDDIPGLRLLRKAGIAVGPVVDPWGVRQLTEEIRRFRPDVLHVHNVFPQISPWAIRRSHALGVPVVHTVHNYRQSCMSGFRFRDGGPCDSCVGRMLPLPAVRHACYRGSRLQSLSMAAGQVAHRATWRSVDRFLALTPFMVVELARLGIHRARIVLRPTAVPDPGPPAPLGGNVLFVARLDEMKGAHLLLDAWTGARPPAAARLRIVGGGPLLSALRTRAPTGGKIDVLGPLDAAGVAREMRDAAIVAIPSLWYEGQPRVLAEALAHGRPVLTTDVGGLTDVDGVGWSVAAAAGPLAAALAVLHDPATLLATSRRARRRYEDRHSPRRALETLLATYGQLAGEAVAIR